MAHLASFWSHSSVSLVDSTSRIIRSTRINGLRTSLIPSPSHRSQEPQRIIRSGDSVVVSVCCRARGRGCDSLPRRPHCHWCRMNAKITIVLPPLGAHGRTLARLSKITRSPLAAVCLTARKLAVRPGQARETGTAHTSSDGLDRELVVHAQGWIFQDRT